MSGAREVVPIRMKTTTGRAAEILGSRGMPTVTTPNQAKQSLHIPKPDSPQLGAK